MEFTQQELDAITLVAKKQAISANHMEDLQQELALWACKNYGYVTELREGNNMGKLYKSLTYAAYAHNMKTRVTENPILSTYDKDVVRTEVGNLIKSKDVFITELILSASRPAALTEYFTTKKSMRTISKEYGVPLNSLSRYIQRTSMDYLLYS